MTKLYVLNRKYTGSTIGCCRADNRSRLIFQLELEVPPAGQLNLILEQGRPAFAGR